MPGKSITVEVVNLISRINNILLNPTIWLISFFSLALISCTTKNQITQGTFAPSASSDSQAIIQVYAARTKGAKKALAVHTWVSVKEKGSTNYTSYEIIGWRLRRNNSALVERTSQPDRDWWGNQPELLLDIRGEKAQRLIPKIQQAVHNYPFKNTYRAWPGPNSNTFTAFIGKQVPELRLDLPSTAIGKDYREWNSLLSRSPSGGLQASLWGLLGVSIGLEEGLELNLLGLNLEIDAFDLAIELPGFGRIGQSQIPIKPTEKAKAESGSL